VVEVGVRGLHLGEAQLVEEEELPELFVVVGRAVVGLALIPEFLEVLAAVGGFLSLKVCQPGVDFGLIFGDAVVEHGLLARHFLHPPRHRIEAIIMAVEGQKPQAALNA
jgi:hypothetical protein